MADEKQTFAEYAQYVIDLKRREGLKESTLEQYALLLRRINPEIGHLKLTDIRPAHLNKLYAKLSQSGGRASEPRATAKVDLKATLIKRNMTNGELAQLAGINPHTVSAAFSKSIRQSDAAKIAQVLGGKPDKFFQFERDMEPLSAKTVLAHHRLISTILGQAEKEMLVPYNAASKATPPRPKKKDVNYFQPEEVLQILEAVENETTHHKLFVYLLIVTGARRGEVAGLMWDDIDFTARTVSINHALRYSSVRGVYVSPTKTGESRTVTIPPEVIQLLKKWKSEQTEQRLLHGDRWNDTDYIFTRDDGTPSHPDGWTDWMRKFSQRHNLPHMNPHAFRHTAASALIASNVDVVTASKVLGHASPTTTENFYAHLFEDKKAAASEVLADALIRPAKKA